MKKQLCKFGVVILVVWSMIFIPIRLQATESTNSSQGITVLPAKFDINANKGDSIVQTMKITNDDEESAVFGISIENFSVAGEDSNIVIGGEDTFGSENDMADWITMQVRGGSFYPHETKMLQFRIDVPASTRAGGKYASIVISMDHLDKVGHQATATAKVVSLVMLTVSGDYPQGAYFDSTKVLQNTSSDFSFNFRVKSIGYSHFTPNGTVTINNILGHKIDQVSFSGGTVLPGQIRVMTTKWQTSRKLFGPYTAKVATTYGPKNDQKLDETFVFWVFSPWAIGEIVLGLLVLYAAFFVYKKRYKLLR